jgi:3-dehydroquinate synthase
VGAFWQPRGVLIDTKVLATLPDREYRAGLAEVVKYGVILSQPFFNFLEAQVTAIQKRDSQVLAHIVAECCRMKASVVVEDEFETKGLRAILNFGHTYGHALERMMGYGELIHGEAVAIGMRCAMDLGVALKRFDAASRDRVVALLKALQLPVRLPAGIPANEVAKAMQSDKKKQNQTVHLILPLEIGKVESTAWPGDELVTATLERAIASD